VCLSHRELSMHEFRTRTPLASRPSLSAIFGPKGNDIYIGDASSVAPYCLTYWAGRFIRSVDVEILPNRQLADQNIRSGLFA